MSGGNASSGGRLGSSWRTRGSSKDNSGDITVSRPISSLFDSGKYSMFHLRDKFDRAYAIEYATAYCESSL